MLGKLAYRNTKRNIKDYLIYLITVTASFSLIFAFNLVANSDEIVKLCSSMDAFRNSLFAVNILIIFVISCINKDLVRIDQLILHTFFQNL